MPADPRIEELTAQSTFIFKGTVQSLNAPSMAAMPATENTAIVSIDEVLDAPPVFGDLKGSSITVWIKHTKNLNLGQQGVFFTSGWIYGDSIAVQEVGYLEHPEDQAGLQERAQTISGFAGQREGRHIRERVTGADLVVVGKVSTINAAEQVGPQPISEHHPRWIKGVIQVEAVEKGALAENEVEVFFPSNRDIVWHKSPKFQVGQEGVWILRKQTIKELDAEVYTALHPLDHHPRERRDQIRNFVQGA